MRPRFWCTLSVLTASLVAACSELPTDPQSNLVPVTSLSAATGRTFCNPATITFGQQSSGAAPGVPYPSTIAVSGVNQPFSKVTATLNGMSHTFPTDLDILLVGPTGLNVLLMSDVGGSADIVGINLEFDDAATQALPVLTVIPTGTYRPTNGGTNGDPFPAPAPPPSITLPQYGTALSPFVGTDVNGTWSLYVVDDGGGDAGSMSGGWCVTFFMSNSPPVANAGGPYTATEGSAVAFNGTGSSDPDGDAITYAWNFGDGSTSTDANPAHTYVNDGNYTVTLVVTDANQVAGEPSTAQVAVSNAAPVLGPITDVPLAPIPLGTTVSLAAGFTDAGVGDTHTGTVVFRVGSAAQAAAITEENGSGNVSASAALPVGVHVVTFTVTDNGGASGSATTGEQYIVVFDAEGSFATGGGWITSPAGAYPANASVSGNASFGFVAKYKRDAITPEGNLGFHLHDASMDFKSTTFEYLVVTRTQADLKGAGEINGVGGYTFVFKAVDGASIDAPDRVSMVITGPEGQIVYDNSGEGSLGTELGGGNISIKIAKTVQDPLPERATQGGRGRTGEEKPGNGRTPKSPR